MPEIKAKIAAGLQKYQQELGQLGDPLGGDDTGTQVRLFASSPSVYPK